MNKVSNFLTSSPPPWSLNLIRNFWSPLFIKGIVVSPLSKNCMACLTVKRRRLETLNPVKYINIFALFFLAPTKLLCFTRFKIKKKSSSLMVSLIGVYTAFFFLFLLCSFSFLANSLFSLSTSIL